MKSFDVLFIHPPRIFAKDYLEVRSAFIMMPVGLVGLADYLEQNGYSTKILNIPMEIHSNKNFRLSKYLKSIDFKICAIELNWILNAYGSIETANIVKRVNPQIKIIMGGLSATHFHEDVINYPSVDTVIRGESEIPLLQLVNHFLKGTPSFKEIPNITYKQNGKIYQNPISYVAEDLDFLNFSNFELMENWEEYIKAVNSISIMMGRSCPYDCTFCGGGRSAYCELFKRDHVILRDPKRIVDDIIHLKNIYPNLKNIYLTHGYYPGTNRFWMKLLNLIQETNIDLGAILEAWRLPVKDSFLREISKTFIPKLSMMNFSVHTFSERVKNLLVWNGDTKFKFSNSDIYNFISQCEKYQLPLILWITAGNPYETVKDVLINIKHLLGITKNYIVKKRQVILFINSAVLISPSSPAFLNENKFGVEVKTKAFEDFYDLFRDLRYSKGFLDDPVTYRTEYLSKRKIKILNNVFYGISTIPIIISLINLISRKSRKKE